MRQRLAVLIALWLPGLIGCATVKKINIYTVPQEMALGEVFSSQVEQVLPILGDPEVSWYLNHQGRLLAGLSSRPDLPYFFGTIDTPELNAFAIPGGHIYFNIGMIEAAQSEAEFLGVVSHEIGHVIAKHSMKQLSSQSIVSILGTVALNQYPNQWAAMAANLFIPTTFLKMSRDAEREADEIGFKLMLAAGYHPGGMVDLFEKLLKLRDKQPHLLDKLFLTHPPTQERIDHIRSMLAATDLPPDLKRDSEPFQDVHRHIVETYYNDGHRRTWAEYLKQKKQKPGDETDEDRLPWDTGKDKKKDKKKSKGDTKKKDKEVDPNELQTGSKDQAKERIGEIELAVDRHVALERGLQ